MLSLNLVRACNYIIYDNIKSKQFDQAIRMTSKTMIASTFQCEIQLNKKGNCGSNTYLNGNKEEKSSALLQ